MELILTWFEGLSYWLQIVIMTVNITLTIGGVRYFYKYLTKPPKDSATYEYCICTYPKKRNGDEARIGDICRNCNKEV